MYINIYKMYIYKMYIYVYMYTLQKHNQLSCWLFRAAMCHCWVYIDPPQTKPSFSTQLSREARKKTYTLCLFVVHTHQKRFFLPSNMRCNFLTHMQKTSQHPNGRRVTNVCLIPGWASSNVASTWCGNNIWLQGQGIVGHATGGDRSRG